MNNKKENLYEHAKRYLDLRWSVFPLHHKEPLIKWKRLQTELPTDTELKDWFSGRKINGKSVTGIGLATGKLSGIMVIDAEVDAKDDLEKMKLPPTLLANSGGGGWHAYFKYPSDGKSVPSPIRIDNMKIDCRADGGYIVLPPSLHSSGGHYKWERDCEVLECPEQVLTMIREWSEKKRGGKTSVPLKKIKDGSRNNTLTSLAGSLHRTGLSQSVIEKTLLAVNNEECKPPLPIDEVKKITASIVKYEQKSVGRSPVITCLSDVEPEEVSWIWNKRIPLGKLTIIEGDPGVGKSTAVLDIAAHVSRGQALPGDETRTDCKPMKVLLLTPEDGLADTIRPRLDKMGADVTKILSLEGVKDAAGNEQHFSLQKDLALMDKHLEGGGYSMVVIDPLNAYMASVDTHKDAEVRTVLTPLSKMAERHSVALVCVRHLTKEIGGKAIYRGQGSIGFAGAARLIHLVGRTAADPNLCAMICTKSNICKPPLPVGFTIEDSAVSWKGEINASAEDLLSPPKPEESSALDEAMDFLKEELSGGAKPSNEIIKDAKAQGISKRTLRRAKKELGIESQKTATGWEWNMSKASTPVAGTPSIFDEIEKDNIAKGTEGETLDTLEEGEDTLIGDSFTVDI